MSENEAMDGPHTHRMDAPSDVTSWTVIPTTRNVVNDGGGGMTLRDEWWHIPTFVVEAIEADAARAEAPRADANLREALKAVFHVAVQPFNPMQDEAPESWWDEKAEQVGALLTRPSSESRGDAEGLDVERLTTAIRNLYDRP